MLPLLLMCSSSRKGRLAPQGSADRSPDTPVLLTSALISWLQASASPRAPLTAVRLMLRR